MERLFGKTGPINSGKAFYGLVFVLLFYPVVFTGTSPHKASGGDNSYQEKIYRLYISNNMDDWEGLIDAMGRDQRIKNDPAFIYETIVTVYGYIGYCLGSGKKSAVSKYISLGEKKIEALLSYPKYRPEAMALRSAFYGFRIAVSPIKSVYYGPKSIETIDKARKLSPLSPQVLLESANIKYYTPELFGGSKVEAITYYEKAVAAMEKHGLINLNWLYLSSMTLLAKAYEENGMSQKANLVYHKILKVEPGFKWVRDELFPEFRVRNNIIS